MAVTNSTVDARNSGLKAELAIIPRWAIVTAALIFLCIPVLFTAFVWRNEVAPPAAGFQILISLFPATIIAVLILMIGYVNRDAGRRGMSRTLWTLIVILVPNAIGFILYFLLRNPIRTQCPKCGSVVDPRANYCPNCRHNFHPTCPQCKASVRTGDAFCANCGAQVQQM